MRTTKKLDESHLTDREKKAAVGVTTVALILIAYGASYDAFRIAALPTIAFVAGVLLIVAAMLEVGRREEARSAK